MYRVCPKNLLTRLKPGAFLVAGLLTLPACTNVIVPPPQPLDPQRVFVLDHGRHASLVLPARGSGIVRYAYGDWRYYAEGETGPAEASAAVLLPTDAGLGRRILPEPPTAGGVRRAMRVGVEHVHEVVVEWPAVAQLREALDSIFQANEETLIYNASYDLEFVRHPRPYTIFRNSNWMVVDWLRRLGCRVHGLLLASKWRVEPPAAISTTDASTDTQRPQ